MKKFYGVPCIKNVAYNLPNIIEVELKKILLYDDILMYKNLKSKNPDTAYISFYQLNP